LNNYKIESNWSGCSNSEPDLIIIPLLFFVMVTEPVVVAAFIGHISIAIDGGLCLDIGNFNRNTPVLAFS
jgi:hypothetical protein